MEVSNKFMQLVMSICVDSTDRPNDRYGGTVCVPAQDVVALRAEMAALGYDWRASRLTLRVARRMADNGRFVTAAGRIQYKDIAPSLLAE